MLFEVVEENGPWTTFHKLGTTTDTIEKTFLQYGNTKRLLTDRLTRNWQNGRREF